MNKLKIKITIPGAPSNADLSQFLDIKNKAKDIDLFVNSEIESPDCWFVIEDLDSESISCKIDPNNIYFLGSETSHEENYYKNSTLEKFLSQFAKIFSPYNTLQNEIKSIPFLPWMINSNHGETIYDKHTRDIYYFKELKYLEKTKHLSVICSDKKNTPGQIKRFEFVKKIKEHFGEDIDWFGNGINQINSKWEGISKYKYHLVIENSNMDYVVSEKLFDSYLGLSFPIYFGGKKSIELLPENSLLQIDIDNFDESKKTIEKTFSDDFYNSNLENIIKTKNLICDDLNFINRIIDISKSSLLEGKKKNITLKSIGSIQRKQKKIFRIKKNIKKIIS